MYESKISHAFKHVFELCGIDSEKYHCQDFNMAKIVDFLT